MKPKKSNSQKKGVFTVDKSVNSREHGLSSDSFEDEIIKELIIELGNIKPITYREIHFMKLAVKKARQKEREEILKLLDSRKLECYMVYNQWWINLNQLKQELRK